MNLDAQALVLTRDAATFKRSAPHLAGDPAVQFCVGDVRDFEFPEGDFSHIIHAATTSAVATFNNEDPVAKFETVALGTRRTLEFARQCGTRKFLMTSSGSVYGEQRADEKFLPEDHPGAPDTANPEAAALGEGKRAAEFYCAAYAKRFGIETKIARCFSFVGPYLQMDIHYAIGNFIRNAVRGVPIRVNGDGTPIRSYLYASDLMVWLWTLLFRGRGGCVYNVGSEEEISIGQLARVVAQCTGGHIGVHIAAEPGKDQQPDRYVPDTRRIRADLELRQTVALREAIQRTAGWYCQIGQDGSQISH
jgi:nucleoside-diphosphate-sugar epimerase